ncbi:hypothetical protein GCM10011487_44560 [Steroidobacter agaridevorans]|uniref:Uncharacterized protein n=1 Tax=Steroidobacter agaridevorans TaxID=2695856 RepID=A0A829YIW2_9GAMM|nr:hypothetical protein GCM10011487_44560 [Steroidobacter agaridevorans]
MTNAAIVRNAKHEWFQPVGVRQTGQRRKDGHKYLLQQFIAQYAVALIGSHDPREGGGELRDDSICIHPDHSPGSD